MKIAICDDEENIRTLIKAMILENKSEVTIDEFEDVPGESKGYFRTEEKKDCSTGEYEREPDFP